MAELEKKEFIVVAGKGGTGKTTTAIVIGRYLASKKRKTLVCLSNALPRYSILLGDISLGPKIRNVSPFLDAVNLEPRACEEEYGLMVLNNRALHRLLFGSKIVRSFLDAVPGLAEWAMLGKSTYHALNKIEGKPEYDTVVLDSPATGHGLDMLALPRAIASAVPTGRMREEALERCLLMEDLNRSEIIPVTLPEEMPVNETLELVRALSKISMNVERIVINRVSRKAAEHRFDKLINERPNKYLKDSELTSPWLLPTAVVLSRFRAEKESIERLSSQVSATPVILPDIPGESLDESSCLMLVKALAGELEGL